MEYLYWTIIIAVIACKLLVAYIIISSVFVVIVVVISVCVCVCVGGGGLFC